MVSRQSNKPKYQPKVSRKEPSVQTSHPSVSLLSFAEFIIGGRINKCFSVARVRPRSDAAPASTGLAAFVGFLDAGLFLLERVQAHSFRPAPQPIRVVAVLWVVGATV